MTVATISIAIVIIFAISNFSHQVFPVIFWFNFSNHFAGISCCNYIFWNIINHKASGNYNTSIANWNARNYTYMSAYPHIISNVYWKRIFKTIASSFYIKSMTSCIDSTVWPNNYIIPKRYFISCKNCKIIVSKKVFSKSNPFPEITVKRLLNSEIFTCLF